MINRAVGLLLVSSAFLIATTYPFQVKVNNAVVSHDRLIFSTPGMLVPTNPAALSDFAEGRLRISLGITALRPSQYGPARIFTISQDHYHSNVTVGQQGTALVIRILRLGSTTAGLPSYVLENFFANTGVGGSLVVDLQDEALQIAANGEIVYQETLTKSPFSRWHPEYRIAIGNEHTWERPWLGTIHSLVVQTPSGTHDLVATGRVSAPTYWQRAAARFQWLSPSVGDWIVNFLFVIPLGFITAKLARQNSLRMTLLLWSVLPATAEAIQVLLPQRSPTASDLTLNLLGAVAGAILFKRLSAHDSTNTE